MFIIFVVLLFLFCSEWVGRIQEFRIVVHNDIYSYSLETQGLWILVDYSLAVGVAITIRAVL